MEPFGLRDGVAFFRGVFSFSPTRFVLREARSLNSRMLN